MISKSRLEELIEQKAKIWCICDYTYHKSKPNKKIEYYDLSSEDVCISPAEFRDYGLRIYNSLGYWDDVRYENLFETKEEAEWYKEFGSITRTERLELPTWEESKKDDIICLFGNVEFNYFVEDDTYCLYKGSEKLLDLEATKENYTLACRKCKELFLGEKENV